MPMVWVDDEESSVKVRVTEGFFNEALGGDVPAGTELMVTPSEAGRWDRIGVADIIDAGDKDPEALKAAGRARRGRPPISQTQDRIPAGATQGEVGRPLNQSSGLDSLKGLDSGSSA